MDGHATPERPGRARHNQHHNPQPASSSTPTAADTEQGNKSTSRRRQGKGANQHAQPQAAWDNAVVSDSGEGHFDANGRYVSGQHDLSAPDESPAPNRGKKNKGKQTHQQNMGPIPQQHQVTAAQAIAAGSPAKAAYAGPTFHASPAASALPKPTFMSKSVPGDAKPAGFQSRLEQEKADSGSSAASTPVVVDKKLTAVPPPREESPLELFFKADRAEKSKLQTPNGVVTPNGKHDLIAAQSAPPGQNWTNIYQQNSGHHQRTESAHSQRGLFALELDGTGVQPGRSPVHQTQALPPSTAPRPNSQAENDPIRRFLLETANSSSPSPKPNLRPPEQTSGYSSDRPHHSPFHHPASEQRSSSGPSTPLPNSQPPTSSLHYGNRNLSPLFQAAKSPSNTPTSQLRREFDRPPQQNATHQQWASIYQQHPGQHLSPPPAQPGDRSAPVPASGLARGHSYSGETNDTPHDTKSMEADLRRILKLTASSNGATGVQG